MASSHAAVLTYGMTHNSSICLWTAAGDAVRQVLPSVYSDLHHVQVILMAALPKLCGPYMKQLKSWRPPTVAHWPSSISICSSRMRWLGWSSALRAGSHWQTVRKRRCGRRLVHNGHCWSGDCCCCFLGPTKAQLHAKTLHLPAHRLGQSQGSTVPQLGSSYVLHVRLLIAHVPSPP